MLIALVNAMVKVLKGCRLSGKDYSAGEIIHESIVGQKALGKLCMMKILQIVEEKVKPADKPKPKKRGVKDELLLRPDQNQ